MAEIPVLKGWVNLTEAAGILGVSRQAVHKMTQKGVFKTLHKIPGARDTLIVADVEVEKLADIRQDQALEKFHEVMAEFDEKYREDF